MNDRWDDDRWKDHPSGLEAEPSPKTLWRIGEPWRDLRDAIDQTAGVTAVTWNGTARWIHTRARWQLRLPTWHHMRSDGIRQSLQALTVASPCGIVTLTAPSELGAATVHATTPVLCVLDGLVDPHEIHERIDELVSRREDLERASRLDHPVEPCGAPYCGRLNSTEAP